MRRWCWCPSGRCRPTGSVSGYHTRGSNDGSVFPREDEGRLNVGTLREAAQHGVDGREAIGILEAWLL